MKIRVAEGQGENFLVVENDTLPSWYIEDETEIRKEAETLIGEIATVERPTSRPPGCRESFRRSHGAGPKGLRRSRRIGV